MLRFFQKFQSQKKCPATIMLKMRGKKFNIGQDLRLFFDLSDRVEYFFLLDWTNERKLNIDKNKNKQKNT